MIECNLWWSIVGGFQIIWGKNFKFFLWRKHMKNIAQFANPTKIPKCTLRKFCNLAKIPKFILQALQKNSQPKIHLAKFRKPQIHLAKISQGLWKIRKPALPCEIPCEIWKAYANSFRNLANSNSLCANSNSHLNLYLKASKPCIHFTNPSAPSDAPHHLVTPKWPLVFSPMDVPRPTIWRGDLHLSLHFGYGAH